MNSILSKIDYFMSQRKSSEKGIIFISLFSAIIYIGFTYLQPITNKELEKSKKELQQSQSKLSKQIEYIKSKSQGNDDEIMLKKLTTIVEKLNLKYKEKLKQNSKLDNNLKDLSKILHKDKLWTLLFDQYSKIAKKHNLKINYITNSISQIKLGTFNQSIKFNFSITGKFKNIIKLLDEIEKSYHFIEITDISLNTSDKITINFTVIVRELKY